MKKSVLIYVCALLTGIFLFSCKPSDDKLQKEVNKALVSQTMVSSTVKDAVVTLTGTVDSEDAKAAAETAVKTIKDIKSVVNNIEVKKPEPVVQINPDEVLSNTITAAINAGGFKEVGIAVSDGVITLTGSAKKSDLQKIMQIANEAKPKKVINQLKLK